MPTTLELQFLALRPHIYLLYTCCSTCPAIFRSTCPITKFWHRAPARVYLLHNYVMSIWEISINQLHITKLLSLTPVSGNMSTGRQVLKLNKVTPAVKIHIFACKIFDALIPAMKLRLNSGRGMYYVI